MPLGLLVLLVLVTVVAESQKSLEVKCEWLCFLLKEDDRVVPHVKGKVMLDTSTYGEGWFLSINFDRVAAVFIQDIWSCHR